MTGQAMRASRALTGLVVLCALGAGAARAAGAGDAEVARAEQDAVERVVESPGTDVRPQFLPDGSGIVFNREHDGRIELWLAPLPPR